MSLGSNRTPVRTRRARAAARIAFLTLTLSALAAPLALAADPPASDPAAQPSSTAPKKYYADIWAPRTKTGAIHLHGGVFAPVNASATSPTLGARIGINVGAPLLLGVSADWTHRSKSLLEPQPTPVPSYEPQRVLATVNADLVPVMLFLQARLVDRFFLVPYLGVGAGYEWLMLNAKDYRDGRSGTVTYSNPAWQAYGGLGLKLSEGVRMDTEIYYNGGALARDVVDENGATWRERVDVNGVGARVGLNLVY